MNKMLHQSGIIGSHILANKMMKSFLLAEEMIRPLRIGEIIHDSLQQRMDIISGIELATQTMGISSVADTMVSPLSDIGNGLKNFLHQNRMMGLANQTMGISSIADTIVSPLSDIGNGLKNFLHQNRMMGLATQTMGISSIADTIVSPLSDIGNGLKNFLHQNRMMGLATQTMGISSIADTMVSPLSDIGNGLKNFLHQNRMMGLATQTMGISSIADTIVSPLSDIGNGLKNFLHQNRMMGLATQTTGISSVADTMVSPLGNIVDSISFQSAIMNSFKTMNHHINNQLNLGKAINLGNYNFNIDRGIVHRDKDIEYKKLLYGILMDIKNSIPYIVNTVDGIIKTLNILTYLIIIINYTTDLNIDTGIIEFMSAIFSITYMIFKFASKKIKYMFAGRLIDSEIVCINKNTYLYLKPNDESSKTDTNLLAGSRIKVIHKYNGWSRIEINNNGIILIGWVKDDDIEILDIPYEK